MISRVTQGFFGQLLEFLLCALGVVLGVFQIVAIAALLSSWFDGYVFLASVLALFVSGIPLLGTVLGIWGATSIFGFNVFVVTILLAFPMLIFPLTVGGIGSVFYYLKKKFKNSKQ